jgi:acyl-CoA thioesterase-1
MRRIQGKRCGATRPIHYYLIWLTASLVALVASGCSPEAHESDAAPSGAGATAIERTAPASTPASKRGAPAKADFDSDSDSDSDVASDSNGVVVFLGTSLTAGYGLREEQAFPALIQEQIRAAGLGYRVVNAGVSGDTSAGGLRRLDWLLRLPVSVLVLELGANDMLRGLSVEALARNLEAIVSRTQSIHPESRLLIAGMRAAPNLGSDYRDAFDEIYPALAKRHGAEFIPFLLEDVAARRKLNQADGIHPTADGHELIAERVWIALEPLLRND